ncbi:MAG: T9SS type A sorting domain-containing protein [Bacteroidetes bacterium]|nr:T9SS type A sorting domain-containing protein [Bacteroidota bacterium]
MKALHIVFLSLGLLASVYLQAQPSYFGPNYIHANSDANCFGDYTVLNTSLIGNTVTDKIIFTHVWGLSDNTHEKYMLHSNGLWYTGSDWSIYDETRVAMDTNFAYNVLNCKQNGTAFTHTVTTGNSVLNWSVIDNSALNNNPNAVFFITKTWDNGVYDTAHVGVWYDQSLSKWTVYNENSGGILELNSTYNIFVPNTGTSCFKHVATDSYYITNIDNPLTNGNQNVKIFVVHDYTTSGGSQGYVNDEIGVWYEGAQWTIYTESISPLWAGATFNVLVIADWPVGVRQNEVVSANLKLSPNPARENVQISLGNESLKMKSVEVTTQDGRRIIQHEFAANLKTPYQLDITGLASGLYIISVMTDEGLFTGRLSVVK